MEKSDEKSQRYLHYLECEKLKSNHPSNRKAIKDNGDIITTHFCWDLSEIY